MSRVKEFGAVGDGVADDTAALQHAVDDGDGVMELTKGTYRITKPIVLDTTKHGPLGIRGDQGTARVVMAGTGPAFEILGAHRGTSNPETVRAHTWEKERMPILSGFEIVGAHPQADGIRLLRTMKTTIRGVLIRRCRYGIHLVERNRNFVLSNSHIYQCADTGLFFDHVNLHQTNIVGNHISYNGRAGIRQLNGDVHNVQIIGNDIEYNSGGEERSGEIVLEAPDGIISEYTIASNTLQATRLSKGANLLLSGREGEEPMGVRLVAITGNVIGSRDGVIDIRNGSRITITGNTMYGGESFGTRLRNCIHVVVSSNTMASRPAGYEDPSRDGLVLEDCVGCVVGGNILEDCRYGEEGGGGAITLRRCRDTSVSGCQILDPQFRGVHLHDCARCRVCANSIVDRRPRRVMTAAIEVTGRGENNLIQHNAIHEGLRGGIRYDDSSGEAVNNTVWS